MLVQIIQKDKFTYNTNLIKAKSFYDIFLKIKSSDYLYQGGINLYLTTNNASRFYDILDFKYSLYRINIKQDFFIRFNPYTINYELYVLDKYGNKNFLMVNSNFDTLSVGSNLDFFIRVKVATIAILRSHKLLNFASFSRILTLSFTNI